MTHLWQQRCRRRYHDTDRTVEETYQAVQGALEAGYFPLVVGIKASKKNLSSVAFSPDGTTLATSGLGDDISLWSLPSGEQIGTLSGHKVAVGSLEFQRVSSQSSHGFKNYLTGGQYVPSLLSR